MSNTEKIMSEVELLESKVIAFQKKLLEYYNLGSAWLNDVTKYEGLLKQAKADLEAAKNAEADPVITDNAEWFKIQYDFAIEKMEQARKSGVWGVYYEAWNESKVFRARYSRAKQEGN